MTKEFSVFTSTTDEQSARIMPYGLCGVSCEGDIDGLMLSMRITQHYANRSGNPIELVYTFPVGFRATVLEVIAKIGERVMKGSVQSSELAEQIYEETLERKDSAFKLELNESGLLTGRLGNLHQGETAEVTIRYAEPLCLTGTSCRLCVPFLIDPDYYGDPAEGFNDPENLPGYAETFPRYGFEMTLRVRGALAASRVSTPSHPKSHVSRRDGTCTVCTHFEPLDRDWVCLFETVNLGESFVSVTRSNGQWHAAAAFAVPYPRETRRTAIACKILVDCSGSMGGSGEDIASQIFRRFVSRLDGHDRISLTRFGSDPQCVFDMREVCNWKIKRLLRKDRQLFPADLGGTELESALENIYAQGMDLRNQEARLYGTPVLLITDGEVWQTESIISRAIESGHRLHVIAVGMGSNPGWLRKAAELTHGSISCVSEVEDADRAADEVADRLIGGIVRDTRVNWPDATMQSPAPAVAYAGETVWSFASFDVFPKGEVCLNTANGMRECKLPSMEPSREDDAIERMFAAMRMNACTNDLERADIAQRYGLLSETTQWILTLERDEAEKTDEDISTERVAQPMLKASLATAVRARDAQRSVRSSRICCEMSPQFLEAPCIGRDDIFFWPDESVRYQRSSRKRVEPPLPAKRDNALITTDDAVRLVVFEHFGVKARLVLEQCGVTEEIWQQLREVEGWDDETLYAFLLRYLRCDRAWCTASSSRMTDLLDAGDVIAFDLA